MAAAAVLVTSIISVCVNSSQGSSPTLDGILTAALELEADDVAQNRPQNPPVEYAY
jgi:hypothetical protein